MFKEITFASPYFFLLLLIIPVIIAWHYKWGKKKSPALSFSNTNYLFLRKKSLKEKLSDIPLLIRIIGIILLTIALARPQSFSTGETVYTEGI
ncbi:MAG TPA: BatA domain-containing protein, partial [Ignavibacteriaceae bacterium]|nr:BatA domain-containing protein [Ignavibacteriaceae bacterium]